MHNPSRTGTIAKTLFLAETFYRYRVLIFRDHGTWPTEYPSGYLHLSIFGGGLRHRPFVRARGHSPSMAPRTVPEQRLRTC
jgi:hypothetical protein